MGNPFDIINVPKVDTGKNPFDSIDLSYKGDGVYQTNNMQTSFEASTAGQYDTGLHQGDVQEWVRGENQSNWAKLGNAFAKLPTDIGGQAIQGVGGMIEFAKHGFNSANMDFDNALAQFGTKIEQAGNDAFPIYMSQASQSKDLLDKLGSGSFWTSNMSSIASTLSLMLPVMGVMKGFGLAGKLFMTEAKWAKLGRVISAVSKGTKEIAGMTKGEQYLMNLQKITGVKTYAKNLTGAILSRSGESFMESNQVYHETYDDTYAQLKEKHPEYSELELDTYSKQAAGEAAATTYNLNWMNLLFDIPEMHLLLGGKDWTKVTGGFFNKAATRFATESGLEGIEELIQAHMSGEGKVAGQKKVGIHDYRNEGQRLWEEMNNADFWTQGIFGTLGGTTALGVSETMQYGAKRSAKSFANLVQSENDKINNDKNGKRLLNDDMFHDMLMRGSVSQHLDLVKRNLEFAKADPKSWGLEDKTLKTTGEEIPTIQLIDEKLKELDNFRQKYNQLSDIYSPSDVRFAQLLNNHVYRSQLQGHLTDIQRRITTLTGENTLLNAAQGNDITLGNIKNMHIELGAIQDAIKSLTEKGEQNQSKILSPDDLVGKTKKEKKALKKVLLSEENVAYGQSQDAIEATLARLHEQLIDIEEKRRDAENDYLTVHPGLTPKKMFDSLQNLYNNERELQQLQKLKVLFSNKVTNLNKEDIHIGTKEGKEELEAKREAAKKEAAEKVAKVQKEAKEKEDLAALEKLKKEKIPAKVETTAEPVGEEGSGQVVENTNNAEERTYSHDASIKAERDALNKAWADTLKDAKDPDEVNSNFTALSKKLDDKEYNMKKEALFAEIRAEYDTKMEKVPGEQSSESPINPNDLPAQVKYIRTIFARIQTLRLLPTKFETPEARVEGFKEAMKLFQEILESDSQLEHDFNLIRFTFDQIYGGTTKLDYNDVFMTDAENKVIQATQGLKLTSEDGDYQPLTTAEKKAAEKAILNSLKPTAPGTVQEIDSKGNIVVLGAKSVNAANQLAYGTSVEYEDQAWTDGRTPFVTTVQTSNALEELEEPMIIVPGFYEEGEELFVQVDRNYSISNKDGQVIENYETLSKDERDRHAKGEFDALYGLIPFIVTNKDGKIVAHLHDIDFMREERVAAKINGEDNLLIQRKKILAIRKYIFNQNRPIKIVITGKGYGHINFNLDAKGEINDRGNRTSEMFKDPNLPIGLARNDRVMITKETPASAKYKMLNTQVRNGAPYALLKLPNNVYFPAFLNPDKVGKKYATSMMKVLAAFVYKESQNIELKELSSQLQQEIFKSTSINIHTREGLKQYFNLFIYTAGINDLVLSQSAKGQSEQKRYVDLSTKEGAPIIQFALQGERRIEINSEKDFQDVKLIQQLQSHLENMFISFKFKHMDSLEDFNFPVIDIDNNLMDNQMSYTQFVKNHTTVNIVGHEVKDAKGKTHYFYTNNPIITYSVPDLEPAKPKEVRKEEVKKEEVKKKAPARVKKPRRTKAYYAGLVKQAQTANIELGKGGNAIVYDIPGTDFVLRVPRGVKLEDVSGKFKTVSTPFEDRNFGQAVGTFGNAQILMRQEGTPAGLSNIKDLTQEQADEAYLKALTSTANMPQEAYDKFADDLRFLNSVDAAFDPSKSNNVLIDEKKGTFNLVDINPKSTYENSFADMAITLMGNTYAYRYKGTQDLIPLYKEIFNKALEAATKQGLKIQEPGKDSSLDYSRKLADIDPNAVKEVKPEKKVRGPRKGPRIGGGENSSLRPDMNTIISDNLWNANKNRIFAKDMHMTEEYWNNLSLEEQKNIIDCL